MAVLFDRWLPKTVARSTFTVLAGMRQTLLRRS
jgi:hypothetical protein